jgi:hypothetical protein
LHTELSLGSLVTILEYYGEAIQDGYPVPPLDFQKLSGLIGHPNLRASETAIWLLWNCLGRQQLHQDLIHRLFMTSIRTWTIQKYYLFIWSYEVIHSTQADVDELAIPQLVERVCEVLAGEAEDCELECQLIGAIWRVLNISDSDRKGVREGSRCASRTRRCTCWTQ